MENNELEFQGDKGPEEKLHEDFSRLQKIADVLRQMGLNVIDELINIDELRDPNSRGGFPIVRDGVDGIRASYSERKGLTIWFTNGFEYPDNPKRQEVEQKLKEEGLI